MGGRAHSQVKGCGLALSACRCSQVIAMGIIQQLYKTHTSY